MDDSAHDAVELRAAHATMLQPAGCPNMEIRTCIILLLALASMSCVAITPIETTPLVGDDFVVVGEFLGPAFCI